MKGYKLGREDGKTGGGGYGSRECSVSMSCSVITTVTRPHVERIHYYNCITGNKHPKAIKHILGS